MKAPAEFTHVPPSTVLGGPKSRCARCGTVLRPGQPRPVVLESSGAVRCVECPARSRQLLAVEPIARAVYAACAGNKPLVRVYSIAAAPYLGVMADTAALAIDTAIDVSGVVTLVEGVQLENALLRSEVASLRAQLARTNAGIRELNDTAGDVLAHGIFGSAGASS